jgi:hypothetical protein
MKIFQINDCDWWIGESLEACVQDYRDNVEDDPDYTEDARELTEEELDRLKFTICDDDERPTGEKRTFREQLAAEIAAGGEFPRMFASTEY